MMKTADNGFEAFLSKVVSEDDLHCRWLNTLSLMENVGARKISACQDAKFVSEDMLRHSVEEARHAWLLKKQLSKFGLGVCPTYEDQYLISPRLSRSYLNKLDVRIAKKVKAELRLVGQELKNVCYLLVTFAIEVKADRLYKTYENVLNSFNSSISVRSILAEEQAHLEQMVGLLSQMFDDYKYWADAVEKIEEEIFTEWLDDCRQYLVLY